MTQATLFESTTHDPGGKVRIAVPSHWTCTALFSPDLCYRYKLIRRWDVMPLVVWIMMNPSTADLEYNDPTVAKCCKLSGKWGYGGVAIGNVCAYRATDNRRLLDVEDPVGPDNRTALLEMAQTSALTILAHGRMPGTLPVVARHVKGFLEHNGVKLHALRVSKDGCPHHPLYLPEKLEPFPYHDTSRWEK